MATKAKANGTGTAAVGDAIAEALRSIGVDADLLKAAGARAAVNVTDRIEGLNRDRVDGDTTPEIELAGALRAAAQVIESAVGSEHGYAAARAFASGLQKWYTGDTD